MQIFLALNPFSNIILDLEARKCRWLFDLHSLIALHIVFLNNETKNEKKNK